MSSAAASGSPGAPTFPVRRHVRQEPTGPFPYSAEDLQPSDAGDDAHFYASPRLVTHIDDHAILALMDYYHVALPIPGSNDEGARFEALPAVRILDLCSSWVSHYPRSLLNVLKLQEELPAPAGPQRPAPLVVAGLGMQADELDANPVFKPGAKWLVHDLNANPDISSARLFHAFHPDAPEPPEPFLACTTCVVSVDYLTSPLAVLTALHRDTVPGGTIHLVISNRCFPTKAVRRWLRISEEERLEMCADYLVWAGWRDVEIVTLCDGTLNEGEQVSTRSGGLNALFGSLGFSGARCDPLWVVRGTKNSS